MHKKMDLTFVKKMTLLFLLVSAFLFSASLAAGGLISLLLALSATDAAVLCAACPACLSGSSQGSWFVNKAAGDVDEDAISTFEESTAEEIDATIHERFLKASTKDYGTYDPTPSVNKPPYRVIQN